MTMMAVPTLALKALLILASVASLSAFSSNVARGQRSVAFGVERRTFFALQESTDPESVPETPVAPVVPVVAETVAPVVIETAAPVVAETEAPVVAETAAPAVAETAAPAADAAAPAVAETAAPAAPVAETAVAGAATAAAGGETAERPDTYVRCGKCQTIYALTADDLGPGGRGRRLECSVCNHSWFQSKDRLMDKKDGFEYAELPQGDLERIAKNIEDGKEPNFMGEFKLYVGNIAFESTEEDINAIFTEVGPVGDVSLVRDELGRIRGFGFVTMREKEDGQKAIDALDGAEIRGRKIAVRESNN
jgi:predicted Zn finger-like uncharacterized protein